MIYQNKGFTLISSVFLLIILALIATYIISIGLLTQSASNFAVQGLRAYYATKSGVEWVAYRTTAGAGPYSCPAGSIPPSSIVLTPLQNGLNGFRVTVTCTPISFNEAGMTYSLFQVTAKGEYGTLGNNDYVSRQIIATVVQPDA